MDKALYDDLQAAILTPLFSSRSLGQVRRVCQAVQPVSWSHAGTALGGWLRGTAGILRGAGLHRPTGIANRATPQIRCLEWPGREFRHATATDHKLSGPRCPAEGCDQGTAGPGCQVCL